VREADGEKIKERCQTKEEAYMWLNNYIETK